MRVSYLLFFISLSVFSQTQLQIQLIPNPKTIDDFDHQFKGCLENSECDLAMGLQLTRWKDLLSKIGDEKVEASKRAPYIELFRAKYGIPVEFYTLQKSQQGFKPMLFDSPCKEHNPKEGPKILKGTAFVKSLSKEKAVVWRDQVQIEVPTGELLLPQPVMVYEGATVDTYQLPLGDQPMYIKNKDVHVLREEDGFFYMLQVSLNGDWKIESVDSAKLSKWEDHRSEVTCPKDKKKLDFRVFGIEFCKTVWNEDLKKTQVVKMHQGCVI